MEEEIQKSFLGSGWSFPPTFSDKTMGVEMVEDAEDIGQSLEILLSTRLGERIMVPKYGCNLDAMIFESMTTSFTTYIKDLIRTAILYHEPRIQVEKIDLSTENENEGLIMINIQYLVRITNTRSNLVYPFYIDEATDL